MKPVKILFEIDLIKLAKFLMLFGFVLCAEFSDSEPNWNHDFPTKIGLLRLNKKDHPND
jgi:hypothetical protein